jgi:hypothetical protein
MNTSSPVIDTIGLAETPCNAIVAELGEPQTFVR